MDDERLRQEVEHWRSVHGSANQLWGWETPAGKLRVQRRAELLVREGRITRGKHALELGCGTGIFLEEVAETQARITAIDVVPEFIDEARRRVHAEGVTFEIQDAHKMTFRDGTFDTVYGSSVLHHLELDPALAEIHRVLKPGGIMVFAEPNMANPHVMLQKNIPFLKRLAGDTPTETAFFRWPLRSALQAHGFENIRITPHDFLHPWVPERYTSVVRRIGSMLERAPLLREIAGSLLIVASKS